MKIYIAGPMTGYENYNRPMFNAVAQQMLSGGHVALNPATLPDGLSQREYMDICLAMLRCADAIHMLHGWKESEGAVAEHAMAKKLGIKISYQFEGGRPMSNIDKQALRERYSPQPVPKCHICGAEMTIQRMSASRITYGCTGATYDDAGCHYTVGRSIADDHYAQSRITVVDMSDPDVLALLDDLEAAEHTAAVDHEAACSLVEENEEVKRKLAASEKRIAELEARAFNPAILDVIAERQRQQSVEGWTPEHDDQYEDGELIDAAACYAKDSSLWDCIGEPPSDWPWNDEWWKPSKSMRRNLIKAGALILAEIERRDRAAGIGKGE